MDVDQDKVIVIDSDSEQEQDPEPEPETDEDMDIEFIPNNQALAESKKNDGNDQYKAQNYQAALRLYTEAITLCPDNAAYYGNRSACLMMMGDYRGALKDSRDAIQIDDQFAKGYDRIIKCCLSLGDVVGAEQAIKKLADIGSNNDICNKYEEQCRQLRMFSEKVTQCYEKKDFRTAVFHADNALKIAPGCLKFKLLKGECLALLGRVDEANDIAVSCMKSDSASADAVYVRGLCLYYKDNLDKGLTHFQQVLTLDPDHSKAKVMRLKAKSLKEKKESGNKLFKVGKFREAHKLYTEALEIDPLNSDINSKLLYNRALMNSKIGSIREAITDCSNALKTNPTYLKVIMLRAKCHNEMEMYEECVKDYEAAFKIEKTNEIKSHLKEAKIALKRSKRKDYYKILGIDKRASDDEIKKAYRKRALVHHPDRHANASEDEKREQEKKFKEIGEAYAVLSDKDKKDRFDNGHDLDDVDIDPSQMYRQFFHFTSDFNQNPFNFF